MAGHTITPYELFATRKFARKDKDARLPLAALGKKTPVDVLDVLENEIMAASPSVSGDQTRSVHCELAERDGDHMHMVFACDVSGEREVIHDGDEPGRPVVFTKGEQHVARFYSCCLLWRPSTGTDGLILIHSPWGRGGSKAQILSVIQRALDEEPDAAAKLHAHPKIPRNALDRIVRNAEATRITYTRHTGVTSEFNRVRGRTSAPAEMALVVKGSSSLPYRNALAAALKAAANRDQFFTVSVRGEDGAYHEETFDDVEIDITTPGGVRKYSVRDDTIPSMGFNYTPQINRLYFGLPEDDHDVWAEQLLEGTKSHLRSVLRDVRR